MKATTSFITIQDNIMQWHEPGQTSSSSEQFRFEEGWMDGGHSWATFLLLTIKHWPVNNPEEVEFVIINQA